MNKLNSLGEEVKTAIAEGFDPARLAHLSLEQLRAREHEFRQAATYWANPDDYSKRKLKDWPLNDDWLETSLALHAAQARSGEGSR